MLPCVGRGHYRLFATDDCRWRGDDATSMHPRVPEWLINIDHFQRLSSKQAMSRRFISLNKALPADISSNCSPCLRPDWVIRVGLTSRPLLPVYPNQRTSPGRHGMS